MTDGLTSKPIAKLKPGDPVTMFFVIRKIEMKTKKNGDPFLTLEFGDATGRISSTLWDDARSIYERFRVGDIVKVQGTVGTYKDALQLSVERFRKAEPADNVKAMDFVKKGNIDVDALKTRLDHTIDSIETPDLKNLLKRIFNSDDIREAYFAAPGGKLWHHAYTGGLLEHTLSIVRICETMAEAYPSVNRDLLVAGGLLHDFGKIDEYGFDKGFIDFTDEGRLWGHISIGAQRVRSIIEEMEKEGRFSDELKKQLIHLILSHQGELDHGSPVLPATLEAIILYYADEMDSKANAFQHIIERDSEPGRNWSKYIPMIERFLYLGKADKED